MWKAAMIAVGSLIGLFVLIHAVDFEHNEDSSQNSNLMSRIHGVPAKSRNEQTAIPETEVTVSMAQNDDFYLCNDPFFAGIFENMKLTYAVGIENVTVEMLEQETFSFIRAWPQFSEEEKTAWIEHVKDIPRQFVDIIQEDHTVLDNCDNFSVAMVGPP